MIRKYLYLNVKMINRLKYLNKIIRSNFTRLPFPHKMSYIVTYRCNLRCKMCNIWKKDNDIELSLGELERFFSMSNRFSWIGITGGEPFLKDNILDIVRIIADNCKDLVAIYFATNGTLTDRILTTVDQVLTRYRINPELFFTLSIDGPPYLHDQIRGQKGTWNKCMKTFRLLKNNRFTHPRIGITLSHNNLGQFFQTFKALKDFDSSISFDDIIVNVFQKSSFYYENAQMPDLDYNLLINTIDEILSMDKDPFTINNFLRRNYLRLYKKYAKSKKCPLKCQALSSTCIMDPKGDIYPCGIYNLKIANIKDYEYSLKKIWDKSDVKNLSKECAMGVCPGCWSPCDAYNAIAGSLLKPDLWKNG